MVAGILLGPTVLAGSLARPAVPGKGIEATAGGGLLNEIFPLQVFSFLDLLGVVALVLFMFLLGLEVQHRLLRGRERQIVVVSLALIVVPVGAGFLAGAALDSPTWRAGQTLAGTDVSFLTYSLFIGAALSVSASAALARILQEKRMMKTDLGAIGMGASTVVTLLMFLVLAAGVASAEGGALAGVVGGKLALTVALVAVLVLIARPLLRLLLDRRCQSPTCPSTTACWPCSCWARCSRRCGQPHRHQRARRRLHVRGDRAAAAGTGPGGD